MPDHQSKNKSKTQKYLIHSESPLTLFFKTEKEQPLINKEEKHYVILNKKIVDVNIRDRKLAKQLNEFIVALETHGPRSNKLPDLRYNMAKAKGLIFHGHLKDSNGGCYVLEWGITDKRSNVIMLTNFAVHENFKFRQKGFDENKIKSIQREAANIEPNEQNEKVDFGYRA